MALYCRTDQKCKECNDSLKRCKKCGLSEAHGPCLCNMEYVRIDHNSIRPGGWSHSTYTQVKIHKGRGPSSTATCENCSHKWEAHSGFGCPESEMKVLQRALRALDRQLRSVGQVPTYSNSYTNDGRRRQEADRRPGAISRALQIEPVLICNYHQYPLADPEPLEESGPEKGESSSAYIAEMSKKGNKAPALSSEEDGGRMCHDCEEPRDECGCERPTSSSNDYATDDDEWNWDDDNN